MSAYATALSELSHNLLLEEALKLHDRALAAEAELAVARELIAHAAPLCWIHATPVQKNYITLEEQAATWEKQGRAFLDSEKKG